MTTMFKQVLSTTYCLIVSTTLFCQFIPDESWSSSAKSLLAQAKNGTPISQLLLGEMLLNGSVAQNVQKDATAASVWLKKASDQNLPKAQVLLGQMLLAGDGVPRDENEAIRLFRMAAESGNARGQFALGKAHDDGQGVVRNPSEALRLYKAAAEAGNPDAQFTLAQCFQHGRLVKSNIIESKKWLDLAVAQGYPEAVESLETQRIEDRKQAEKRIATARMVLFEISDQIMQMAATKQMVEDWRIGGYRVNETEFRRRKTEYDMFRTNKLKESTIWKVDKYKEFLIREAKNKFVDPAMIGRTGWYFSFPPNLPESKRRIIASRVIEIAIMEIQTRW